jgi:TolA-binding protein
VEGRAATTAGTGDLEAEALLLLGTVYLKMEKWEDARHAFQAILKEYPNSPRSVAARNYLEYLKRQG